MRGSVDRRRAPRGRVAGVAGMVIAAGLLASCGGAGTPSSTGAGPSPAPLGGGSELDGVAAASPSSAWAVGSWSASDAAIIEHGNGTAWTWPAGFCAAPSGPGCDLPSTSSSFP